MNPNVENEHKVENNQPNIRTNVSLSEMLKVANDKLKEIREAYKKQKEQSRIKKEEN